MINNRSSSMMLAAVSILALATPALAADLPRKSVPEQTFVRPIAVFSWTGFYVGANAGYVFEGGKSSLTGSPALLGTGLAPVGSAKTLGDGFTIGGTLGYNYQFGNIVAGIEGDLSYTDLGRRRFGGTAPLSVTLSQEQNYLGTVRGRLGYAFDRFLVYGTGGLAFGEAKSSTIIAVPGSQWSGSKNDTKVGFAVGGGVEYAFTGNWSAKIEYLYYDLGKSTYASPLTAGPGLGAAVFGQTRAENKGNIVRAGLNYRF